MDNAAQNGYYAYMSEFLEKFGSVMVVCPFGYTEEGTRAEAHLEEARPEEVASEEVNAKEKGMRLDEFAKTDFAQTENGQLHLKNIGEMYRFMRDSGMGRQQAITMVLGGALVRDKQGQIEGLNPEPAKTAERAGRAEPAETVVADSKKK